MPVVAAAASAAFAGGVGGAVAAALTWGPAAAVAINVGLVVGGTIAMRAISKSMLPKQNTDISRDPSELLVTKRGTVEPREIVYGTVRKAGFLTFYGSDGPNNRNYHEVQTLAGHIVDGFSTVYMDDEAIDVATEINNSGFVTNPRWINSQGSRLLSIRLYDGSQTSSDPVLSAAFGTEWTTAHKGLGCAYIAFRCVVDDSPEASNPNSPEANVWHKGLPQQVTVLMQGKRMYDTREPSHTITNSATWEFSDNSALVAWDYMRWEYGHGIPNSKFSDSHMDAAADICDASQTVWGSDTGSLDTQPRWTCNGVLSMGAPRGDNLQMILDSMMGKLTFVQGQFRVHPAVWEAPTETINRYWVRRVRHRTANPRFQSANIVRGTFCDLNQRGQLVPFLSRLNSADISSRGVKLERVLDLPLVNDAYQAQRAALVAVKQAATQDVWELVCHKRALVLAPHQTVFLNLPDHSINSVQARVTRMEISPLGELVVTAERDWSSNYTYVSTLHLTQTSLPDPLVPASGPPPPPTNLRARSLPAGIVWEWNKANPQEVRHTEVWVAGVNSRRQANLVSRDPGEEYVQNSLSLGEIRYAWVRSVGYDASVSSFHPTDGLDGVVGVVGRGTNTRYGVEGVNLNNTRDAWVLALTIADQQFISSNSLAKVSINFLHCSSTQATRFKLRLTRRVTNTTTPGMVIATFADGSGNFIASDPGRDNQRSFAWDNWDTPNSGIAANFIYIYEMWHDSGPVGTELNFRDIFYSVQEHLIEQ